MDYYELKKKADGQMGKCFNCPICDGRACKNSVPGPGSKGSGTVATKNYDAWKKVMLEMDTISDGGDIDTSIEFFGKKFIIPVFAGPVGAIAMHYSDKYNDISYNDVLVKGCVEAGICAFTGDGIDSTINIKACEKIKEVGGVGIPTIKPWAKDVMFDKIKCAKDAGAFAIATDVDASGLPFLKNQNPPAGSKNINELKEIINEAKVPYIIKGVMNVKGALKAIMAGAEFIYEDDYKLVDDLPTGESLSHIERIDLSKLDSRIYESKFTVMCDVENPLYGINGASYVYGPQKGATEDDLVLLDKGLQHVCQLVKETTGIDYSELSGGGAAGGAGFGCVAFLDAKLKRGIDMIMDLCGFDNEINDCELIITGEGKLDRQSMMGKVLSGIRRRSGNIPVISICGICDADEIMEGISVYEIGRGVPLEESIRNAPKYLAKKAEEINV